MLITNSVVCDMSKGSIYKQIKPPLVDEHAFPLRVFVCMAAHVTFGGSDGIRPTAKDFSGGGWGGGGSNVSDRSTDINRYTNYKLGSLWCEERLHI